MWAVCFSPISEKKNTPLATATCLCVFPLRHHVVTYTDVHYIPTPTILCDRETSNLGGHATACLLIWSDHIKGLHSTANRVNKHDGLPSLLVF